MKLSFILRKRMIKGHDFLGLGCKNWNVKDTLAALPNGVAVGCFDNTWPDNFGDPYEKIRAMCKSGKIAAVRVQMYWSYAHKIVPLDVLKKATPRWEKLAKEFPGIMFFLSPSCEYRYRDDGRSTVTTADLVQRVDVIRTLAPSCVPVLSPWLAPVIPGVKVEHHGAKAKAKEGELVSYDGGGVKAGGFDEEIGADVWMMNNHKALIAFCWSPIYNCAESHNSLKPAQRTATPSSDYIRAMQRLMEPKGSAPKKGFTGATRQLKAPELWKNFAEDMQGANSRDNKPLLVVKASEPVAFVLDNKGKEIAKLSLYDKPGSFEGGLSRYYSGFGVGSKLYGFEMAQRALASAGSEWVYVKVGRTVLGPFHPAFRTPYYR